jgi:hypothetical protein
MQEVKVIEDIIVFDCPHCKQEIMVFIKEINCKIFRHAVFKNNFEQINPHLPFDDCNELVKKDLVFGCAKPFELFLINNKYYVNKCEYK